VNVFFQSRRTSDAQTFDNGALQQALESARDAFRKAIGKHAFRT
jgi:hypothetical protein